MCGGGGGGGHNKFWGSFNKGAGGTKFPPFKMGGGGGAKSFTLAVL